MLNHPPRPRQQNRQRPTHQSRFQTDHQKLSLSPHLDERRPHRHHTIRLHPENPKRRPAHPENFHLEIRSRSMIAVPTVKKRRIGQTTRMHSKAE